MRAQSWLKGQIKVTLLETADSPKINPLTLQVLGKEITTIHTRFGNALKSEFVVFDETIVVHEVILEQGCVSYPFSMYLPATLAPSMHFESRRGSSKVQYVVKAQLGGVAKSSRLTVIGKPLSNKLYPSIVGPAVCCLRRMGIFDHGCLVLGAKVDNRRVQKGRKVKLAVALRNRSEEKIHRLDVQVVEEIYWTAGGSQRREEVKLDCWCDVEISGIKPHTAQCPNVHNHYQKRTTANQVIFPEIHDELLSKSNEFSVLIPARAFDSYAGKLVQISHKVKVLVYTTPHHCRHPPTSTCPSISVPLEIFDPPMEPNMALHQHHTPAEKVNDVVTTLWPVDGEMILTTNGHRYPSAHRKLHSDTEFSYASIQEDEVASPM